MGASGGFMFLWEAIPIWACGCCMGANGGFMGQLYDYTISYTRELVHVAGGLLEAIWKL